jgi:pimeloyl-ACP methyl ester carboxylesterase
MESCFAEKATVVLVHGPWLDAGMWNSVILPLRQHGLQVVAAQLPLTSFEDDLAAIERTLDLTDGPLMLVGHSYSGALIANAALRSNAIQALVFISAITPDVDETVADVLREDISLEESPRMIADRHGFIWMSESEFRTLLAPNAAAHQWALMTAKQKPISVKCLSGRIPNSAWQLLPSSYLIAEQDHVLSAKTQRLMAKRMNAHIYAHPLDYAAAMTEPEVVLDVILEAAHDHLAY